MIIKQTTLDLNGPIVSFAQQPVGVTTSISTAKFVGIATATFPSQTPTNLASSTGTLIYRWYAEGFGALSDGPFLGATIAGTATTTLTLSNLKSPETNNVSFFLTVNYTSSAYSQPVGSAVTSGTSRSTGNAVNDVLSSDIATLTVNPLITITTQPSEVTTGTGGQAIFTVDANLSDSTFGTLNYQWQLDGQNLTDTSSPQIQGSRDKTLIISPSSLGSFDVRVIISNASATQVISNTVKLNAVTPRSILIFEGYTSQNTYEKVTVNLDNGVNYTLIDTTFRPDTNIITCYASEKDIDTEIEIRSSKGLDVGSFFGGNGGSSTIRLTFAKNVEHTILGIPSNSGIFLYRGSSLISAVGKGGNAGSSGNGGAGGGVNDAGGIGSGSGAGSGGARISNGQLTTSGIFGSNSNILNENIYVGDSKADVPSGGRTISCSKGTYWIQQGISPCANNGTIQFRNTDGSLISQSGLILRGFKPGYSVSSTEGKLIESGGNGGNGATGGSGGSSGGGGGGGSGYTDGSISVLSSSQGANNSLKSTINFKIFVPPPPPPPPPSGGGYTYSPPYVEPPPSCPDPDTLILMSNGSQKRAGDLKVGDVLRTQHESTLEWGDYPVLKVNIVKNEEKVKLIFNGTYLICSLTHKLYVQEKGWIRVSDMIVGDIVSNYSLEEIQPYEKGDVVAIEIDKAHAYLSNNLLSHNIVLKGGFGVLSCPDPRMPILMANGTEKKAGDLEVGDLILTQHEKTLEWGDYKIIHKNLIEQRKRKMLFSFDNLTKEVICSNSHVFYVKDKGWLSVQDMQIGDIVDDYQFISFEEIGTGTVVEITVEGAHTYVCCGLLSHNKFVITPEMALSMGIPYPTAPAQPTTVAPTPVFVYNHGRNPLPPPEPPPVVRSGWARKN